jgi:hypothetical protein
VHAAALKALRTQADKVRYACDQVTPPVTMNVRSWLDVYGIHTTRSHASSVVNAWRRDRGLSTTGDLPALTPEMLAELDAITAPPQERPAPPVEAPTEAPADAPVLAPAPVPPRPAARPRGQIAAWVSFVVGGLVSVAANVAHTLYPTAAQLADWTATGRPAADWAPPAGAMVFAAFWPIALILSVEVITRAEWRPGFLFGLARYGGTTLVAAVAAVMSYRHMAGLLAIWGEDVWGAHLGPLAVDGLMVVSAAALLSMSRTRETS